jgi:uncharacterized protein
MRAFAIFLGLIALGLAGIAILGYPTWLLLSPWLDNPKFHRISSRVGMALLIVGFVFVARRLAIADRHSLGFGLPWRPFVAEVGKAVFFGMLLMMPAVLTMIAFDMLEPDGDLLSAGQWVRLVLGGLITGLTVAFIEETFLRGAMLTAIKRESGAGVAIALTSLVYAAVHFFGRYRVRPADVDAGSGVDMLTHILGVFAEPQRILDAFLCLLAVGVLLGMVRVRTGNIAAPIGLHAGWVAVIYVVRETTNRRADAPGSWMLGEFDGFIGWLVLAWTLVLGVTLSWWYRPKARFSSPHFPSPAPPLTPSPQSTER